MVIKCDNLVYTPINAITFRITGDTKCLTPVMENDKIIALKGGPSDHNITLGLTLQIKKTKYKVNIIEKRMILNKLYYDISIAKRTKATTFIMPMLPGNKKLYFWNKLFVNCFVATEKDENCIALLYRWSGDLRYIKFEKILSQFKNFRRRYDPSPHYVMFVFDVPKECLRNYRAFLLGKYSKFDRDYKIDILDFHNLDMDNEIGQILFKSERRKKQLEKRLDATLPDNSELLSIIQIEEETFDPEIYKLKKLI
tara:strand:- start:2409 stop:3170 length:762 start_codon:yes stop_codon:yes gene_type:complete